MKGFTWVPMLVYQCLFYYLQGLQKHSKRCFNTPNWNTPLNARNFCQQAISAGIPFIHHRWWPQMSNVKRTPFVVLEVTSRTFGTATCTSKLSSWSGDLDFFNEFRLSKKSWQSKPRYFLRNSDGFHMFRYRINQNHHYLGGGFKGFSFSPLPGKRSNLTSIFFKWVETTN